MYSLTIHAYTACRVFLLYHPYCVMVPADYKIINLMNINFYENEAMQAKLIHSVLSEPAWPLTGLNVS